MIFHRSIFLTVFVLGVLPVFGVQAQGTNSSASKAKAIKVFAHEVKEQSFVNTLQALGTLKANEATEISASVTEVVSAIHFDDGKRVKAGDILVVLANSEETALLEKARHTLEEAEQQYERVNALIEKKIATRAELDARKLAYDSARAELEATRSRLRDLLIIAPFDGVVGLRNISLGALVRPGDLITTLDDDSVMKLDMSVPSSYLPYLQQGMKIKAKAPALVNQDFEGQIASISSRVDPVTRSVQVRALIPNEHQVLRPGLLMIVELQEPPRTAVVVPEKALIKSAGETWVYVVSEKDGNKISEKRLVQPGERQPGVVEITRGLSKGEWVVSQGHLKLKDGAPVTVTAEDSGSDSLEALLRQQQKKPDSAQDG